jgi:hypothetical protein
MLIVFMFLLQNSDAKLEPEDADTWRKLAAGSVDPVLYRLDFPISSRPNNQEHHCKPKRYLQRYEYTK